MKLILTLHTLLRCLIVFLLAPIRWVIAKVSRWAPMVPGAGGWRHDQLTSNRRHCLNRSFLQRAGLACAVAIVTLLFLCVSSARAGVESFNITNFLQGGVNIVSYPTNSINTGTNINGSGTNTISVGQLTGGPINVQNYYNVGFVFRGTVTATNSGFINFTLVRGVPLNGSSPVVTTVSTNSSVVTNSDWETTSQITLSVPISPGTNVFVNWQTNLDEYYLKPALFLGIYSITNTTSSQGASAWSYVTNAWAGVTKKIIPHSLAGGNF